MDESALLSDEFLLGRLWDASIPRASRIGVNLMKRIFLLCAVLGVAIIVGGCANQYPPATDTAQARVNQRGGLVGPGSVAGLNSGTAGRMGGSRSIP